MDEKAVDAACSTMDEDHLAKATFKALFAMMGESDRYQAEWHQTMPAPEGSDGFASEATYDYHTMVIADINSREPATCMLSDTEFGAVGQGELDQLLEWVNEHPEAHAS